MQKCKNWLNATSNEDIDLRENRAKYASVSPVDSDQMCGDYMAEDIAKKATILEVLYNPLIYIGSSQKCTELPTYPFHSCMNLKTNI